MKKLLILLSFLALSISCGSDYQDFENEAKTEYEKYKEKWPEYKQHWKEETDNWAKNAKKYGKSISDRAKAWESNVRKEEPKRDYIATREDEQDARNAEEYWEPLNILSKGASFNQVAEFMGEPYYGRSRGRLGRMWIYDALSGYCVEGAVSCRIMFDKNGKVEYTQRLRGDLFDASIINKK